MINVEENFFRFTIVNTLLKLIEDKLIDPNTLYGSWAGAYGNFQFMPSTIKRYAIDYDGNKKIELKIITIMIHLLLQQIIYLAR